MTKVKENQKGISRIALIVIILLIVVAISALFGIWISNNESSTKEESGGTNISNNNTENNDSNDSDEDNESEKIIIPANHTHDYNILGATTEATCTEPGKNYYKCECGSQKIEIASQSLGHIWQSAKLTKASTCQTEGELTYKCAKCEHTRTEKLSVISHDFTNQTVENNYLSSEATCTELAKYYYKCQYCDEHGENTYASGTVLGHIWSTGAVQEEPAEDKDGLTIYTCTVCKKTKEEITTLIPNQE